MQIIIIYAYILNGPMKQRNNINCIRIFDSF